jgi:prepilin-type N-terminal cleavage/methylation domain-containing protein
MDRVHWQRGFTLIELIVVFAIVGLVVALVAPLGIRQIEKARSQEEWLILQRTVEGLAFRAFAEGRAVDLEARGQELAWRAGGGPRRVLALHHLFFNPEQSVYIDVHGLAQPGVLEVRQMGRQRTLTLNRWLTEGR